MQETMKFGRLELAFARGQKVHGLTYDSAFELRNACRQCFLFNSIFSLLASSLGSL